MIKYDKVPILKIDLKNTTLEEINSNSKEIKYDDNNLKVDYNGKILVDKNITIKGRGNTTWTWKKKPYQIKFDEEVDLFNLGKAEKWVLLANYADETLIRNHIAFYLGKTMGMKYTNHGINIDLYVDGKYQGVYYLTPKIAINEASVNLKNNDGIIMELDENYFIDDDCYISNSDDRYILKDIKNDKYLKQATTSFMNKINGLEKSFENKNWKVITKNIDIDSFAKYYIITNLTRNGDAYRSSFYMYMDGVNDTIHAGPIWDFDLAFSNMLLKKHNFKEVENNNMINNDSIIIYDKQTQIIYKLLEFKEFQIIIRDIWNKQVKDVLNGVLNEVDRQYDIVKSSAEKNIERWNYVNTYSEYIGDLKEAIVQIFEAFDEKVKSEKF